MSRRLTFRLLAGDRELLLSACELLRMRVGQFIANEPSDVDGDRVRWICTCSATCNDFKTIDQILRLFNKNVVRLK